MSDLNKVMVIGRLGQDPDVRYMPAGKAVATIKVASGEKWKDANGQLQEHTEWFTCTLFGRLAEIAGEYLKKGSQVFIEGKNRTEKWQDQSGNERYTTKVIVDNLKMLSGGQQSQQPQRQPVKQANTAPPKQSAPDFDFDDDIPFAPIGLQYPALLNVM